MVYCSFCYRPLQTIGACPHCKADKGKEDKLDEIKVHMHTELFKPNEEGKNKSEREQNRIKGIA